MMSSCGHGTTFYFLPPTLDFLEENYPYLPHDTTIDRSLLRCQFCDLLDTQYAANVAETGPPNLEKESDIENRISDLRHAITEGIKTDTENTLPKLQRKLSAVVRATDERIIEVWMKYWAVWGPKDGPDRGDEDLKEQEEEDFEIEFPPAEEISTEPVPEQVPPKRKSTEKASSMKTATEKLFPTRNFADRSAPKRTAKERVPVKRTASKKAARGEAAPKVDRKRKEAHMVDPPSAGTTVKQGRPVKRRKK
ncbi:hypothetical protein ONS96_004352 [Cadophora gregata f. sp. sojae]|nr:hypothetical protein ONS96_004352 [Cadophora gregata f. sp. sojae]